MNSLVCFFQPFVSRHKSVLLFRFLSSSNVLIKIVMQMLLYTTF